jgi:hypothetical protein
MPREEKSKRSFRCALIIHVSAKDRKNAAEQFLDVIEQGWVKPADIMVKDD